MKRLIVLALVMALVLAPVSPAGIAGAKGTEVTKLKGTLNDVAEVVERTHVQID